ncbi:pyrroline-5-carboxylate reductase [Algihabitans albus]|uniref:pyrroline-5-carboxylate reductase n=1 Tax=Algihabitans albus TaxID=2164067 RepID=UPI000E5C5F9C|nr:pyrroline-5-carboxylate reductase [Algihabitans albus]
MSLEGPLLLLGCGKMGGALLAGWLDRGLPAAQVTVIEPQAAAVADFTARGVRHLGAPAEVPDGLRPKVVLLAVKPQMMAEALPPLARLVGPDTVFLSIAAGKTVDGLAALLTPDAALVRAMPNTPAAVGRGMSVLYANARVGGKQRALCAELMAAAGETAWIEDEALMDPVTALSGGGPAYVFLLIEVLAKAGIAAGLPADLAERLARVTVAGSGELVHRSDLPPATLRENVTSPGGTTLEALKVLMAEEGLQPLMTKAIAAAARRSRELAS